MSPHLQANVNVHQALMVKLLLQQLSPLKLRRRRKRRKNVVKRTVKLQRQLLVVMEKLLLLNQRRYSCHTAVPSVVCAIIHPLKNFSFFSVQKPGSFKTPGGTEVQDLTIGSGKMAKPGSKVLYNNASLVSNPCSVSVCW